VEALWEEVECVRDWEGLLDVLLLDHSAAEGTSKGGRVNGKARKRVEEEVDEAWRLEEVEESVLLEVLVTALKKAKAEVAGSKKVSSASLLLKFFYFAFG
jgi:cohesin complex subunit SA-1/2